MGVSIVTSWPSCCSNLNSLVFMTLSRTSRHSSYRPSQFRSQETRRNQVTGALRQRNVRQDAVESVTADGVISNGSFFRCQCSLTTSKSTKKKNRHFEWVRLGRASPAWARRRTKRARRRAEGHKQARPDKEAEETGQVRVDLHESLDQQGSQDNERARPPVLKAVSWESIANSSPECILPEPDDTAGKTSLRCAAATTRISPSIRGQARAGEPAETCRACFATDDKTTSLNQWLCVFFHHSSLFFCKDVQALRVRFFCCSLHSS